MWGSAIYNEWLPVKSYDDRESCVKAATDGMQQMRNEGKYAFLYITCFPDMIDPRSPK
jgi:hypothetical protein